MKIERPKITMVTLEASDGRSEDFEIEHAERLLRMPGSGWSLPDMSPYKFDYYDGISRNTEDTKGTEA